MNASDPPIVSRSPPATSRASFRPAAISPATRPVCPRSTIAPIFVAGSSGSPGRIASARAFIRSIISPATLSSTSNREFAEQTSPWLKKMPKAAMSAAASRSASANTRFGLLPPVSSHTCFMLDSPA